MPYSWPRIGHFQEMRLNTQEKSFVPVMYIDYVDEYSCVLTMIKTW